MEKDGPVWSARGPSFELVPRQPTRHPSSPPFLSLLRPLRLVLLACLPLTPVHGWKEWVWENASGTLEWPEAW